MQLCLGFFSGRCFCLGHSGVARWFDSPRVVCCLILGTRHSPRLPDFLEAGALVLSPCFAVAAEGLELLPGHGDRTARPAFHMLCAAGSKRCCQRRESCAPALGEGGTSRALLRTWNTPDLPLCFPCVHTGGQISDTRCSVSSGSDQPCPGSLVCVCAQGEESRGLSRAAPG